MTNPAKLVSVADRLLCCSEGVQRFAEESGFPAERTTLIPIPLTEVDAPSPAAVASARQRYGVGAGPYLLFVGDITYNKGIYDLMEAYAEWSKGHPGVLLVIAGTNREGERFLNRVHQNRGIVYLGRVPHRDVLALIRDADVVVLPSRSEGLPRVILEAVSLGTRVMCPPGIPEFDRHLAPFVLSQVSARSIADALDVILRSKLTPDYPLAMHDVDQVAERLVDVYREVVNSNAASTGRPNGH
jgi:glycosyltransferase involved in cell wall biosynthesis